MSRFAPGQSGNPGGRPKALRSVEEEARKHTALAMQTLASIANDIKAPPAARVTAASVLLDRGWGKARQHMELAPSDEFETWTEEELRAFVLEGAAKIEAEDRAARLSISHPARLMLPRSANGPRTTETNHGDLSRKASARSTSPTTASATAEAVR